MPKTVWGRFWEKVDIRSPEECWEWKRGRFVQGYGQYRLITQVPCWRASRVAWLFSHGHPGELCVLHRCDNPPCCNPGHLFLGTNADNVADKVSKGRAAHSNHPDFLDAISLARRKLTDGDVQEARRRNREGENLRSIGESLGVSHTTLSRALRGLTRYSKTE